MQERLDPEVMEKFRAGVKALAESLFEKDEDGDLPVNWWLIDRTRYQMMTVFPIKYAHRAATMEELNDIMRALMSNISSAINELDVFMRTRPFEEERINKENVSLVDRLNEHPEILERVENLNDLQRDLAEARLELERRQRVIQNQTKKLMAKDAMDGSAYARHICDAMGVDPSEAQNKTFGILLDDLLKKAGLLDAAIENRRSRTDSKKHE